MPTLNHMCAHTCIHTCMHERILTQCVQLHAALHVRQVENIPRHATIEVLQACTAITPLCIHTYSLAVCLRAVSRPASWRIPSTLFLSLFCFPVIPVLFLFVDAGVVYDLRSLHHCSFFCLNLSASCCCLFLNHAYDVCPSITHGCCLH